MLGFKGLTLVLVVLSPVWVVVGGPDPAHATETLHVVIVADTVSEELSDHMTSGVSELRLAIRTNVPKGHLKIKTIDTHETLKPEAILKAVARTPSERRDAVLFFYMGHGAVDTRGESYCDLPDGKLYLCDIIKTLEQLQSRSTVALFDSCQEVKQNLGMLAPDEPAKPPVRVSPLFQSLFFSEGSPRLLVWTSAKKGQYAVAGRMYRGFVRTGGLFTLVLSDTWKSHDEVRHDWAGLKKEVQKQLDADFRSLKRERPRLGTGEEIRQETQTIAEYNTE